jgi:broad specificity phosphatase PhoE/8-oxo-dGTP pyrophosphatase MutT (NUDIX family)
VSADAVIPAYVHYREASVAGERCGTCDFFVGLTSRCSMFPGRPVVDSGYVCDKWSGRIEKLQPKVTATPPDPLSQSDLQVLASMANSIEAPRADLLARKDDAPGAIPFDAPRTLVGKADEVRAAGIAVRAADTGRVLMLQRSTAQGRDPNAGTWEFPGGRLNDGEHPHDGARREWQEEMGVRLPKGRHAGSWRSGVYQGFVHEVPSEASVRLNLDGEDRRVTNPDDPDGDNAEVAAWWHPDHLRHMRALRPELRASKVWTKVEKAGGGVLYVISHAKTRYNNPGANKDRVQGWLRVPIDAQGRKEAALLGEFLKREKIDELHSSDIVRSHQTAQIIGRVTGLKVNVSRKFRPWNLGSFAGHSSEHVVPKLKPFITEEPDAKVDGGEPFNTFKDRFIPALERLVKLAESGERVALVTHSRNVELIEGWLGGNGYRTKIDPKAITSDKIQPATVFMVERNRTGKFTIREVAQEVIRGDRAVTKAQAHPATLNLRVHGVSSAPGGMRVYRMETRDGRYVGRTNATRFRARKGDLLKVQAQDYLHDVQGDPRWTNVGVVGYTDSSHSWKDLEALAGGRLEGEPPVPETLPPDSGVGKDGAPGDAGNLPTPGDPGVVSTIGGDGPTLAAVHVDIPLGGISQAYVDRQTARRFKRGKQSVLQGEFLPVQKGQEWKQLIYGVVLEPNAIDSQDDFMLPHHVEKTAHNYLKKAIRGRSSVAKLQHGAHPGGFSRSKPSIVPVESFIAPVDFSYDGKEQIKKGSWVLAMHVEDPELWQDFLSGKYKAFSVGGSGVRRAVRGAADLVPHGFIGEFQPNYFEPDPRRLALVSGG